MSDNETPEVIENEAVETDAKALEVEGDIAADYLEEFLDIYDMDGDIDIDVRQGRCKDVSVVQLSYSRTHCWW